MIYAGNKQISFILAKNKIIEAVYKGSTKIWEAPHDYERDYLTTVARGSGNIGVYIESGLSTSYLTSISYSTDGGTTWTTTNNVDEQTVTVTVPVNNGTKVLWKGEGNATKGSNLNDIVHFGCTTNFDVEGNIMSILNGDNFYHSSFNLDYNNNLSRLFYSNPYLIDASNLILPANILNSECYEGMFMGCTCLTSAPALPATSLANGCYFSMFNGCANLNDAPALPATTLANNCYGYMFQNCGGLVNAPALPATTLRPSCYAHMFEKCVNLITAPTLPASTLASWSYNAMFKNCSNLVSIKMLATDISANGCLSDWVNGVANSGTFVKNASMTTLPTGANGIPDGWTVEDDTSTLLSTVTAE